MTNDMINKVRRLRDIGHNSREVAAMLGLSIADVKQAASEPDEHTIVNSKTGETLLQRVERKKIQLRKRHMREMIDNNARIRT